MANGSRGSGGGGGWIAVLAVGAGVLVTAWLAVSRSGGKAGRRSMIGRRRKHQDGQVAAGRDQQSPGLLRASIVGASKQMVQSVFGPPRAAAGGVSAVPGEGRQAYWEADTWYYALDPKRKTAMAIRFENGVARGVDFVEG